MKFEWAYGALPRAARRMDRASKAFDEDED